MEFVEGLKGLNKTSYCGNYSIEVLKQFNLTWSITAIVTFFLTLAILLLILFYQSYGSILQRLFIYFTLSIMAYLTALATDLQLQPRLFQGDTGCKWTGYSKTSTYIITLFISCEISIYLLCMMYYQVQQKQLPQLSKSQTMALELGLLIITVVLPPSLLLIPRNRFGVSGALCWINSFEKESCYPQNGTHILEVVIFTVYMTFHVFNLVAYAILVGIFCWLAWKSQIGRTQYYITARRTTLLVILLVLCAAAHLVSVLFDVFFVDKKGKNPLHKGVYFFFCVFTPLVQCIRPIAYMLYLNSVKKFQWESTRNTANRWRSKGKSCCRKARKWLGKKRRFAINSAPNYISEFSDTNLDNQQTEYFTPTITSSMSQYGALAKTSDE